MFKKIVTYALLFSLSLSITGCNNVNNKTTPALSSDSNIDDILNNYNFKISKSVDSKIIYIAFLKNNNVALKNYEVTNGSVININCKVNEEFIVSLHANSTISYSWTTDNNFDNSILSFEKQTKIKGAGNYKNNNNNIIGTSYRRQNFYFKTLKSGDVKLPFKYCHSNSPSQNQDCFKFNILIHIK